jgi:hypothetical protein
LKLGLSGAVLILFFPLGILMPMKTSGHNRQWKKASPEICHFVGFDFLSKIEGKNESTIGAALS